MKKKTYRLLRRDDSDEEPSIREDYTLAETQKLVKEIHKNPFLCPCPEVEHLIQKWNGKSWELVRDKKKKKQKNQDMSSSEKAHWLFKTFGHESIPMVKVSMDEFKNASTKEEKYWKKYWREVMQTLKGYI